MRSRNCFSVILSVLVFNIFIFLCVVAGYAVTLNPNRQLAYIVERWLIRFQSARLILHGGFPELGSLKSASRFTVLCLPPLARMVTPVRGVSRPSLGNATCLNVTPTALLLRGGLCSLPQCVGVVVVGCLVLLSSSGLVMLRLGEASLTRSSYPMGLVWQLDSQVFLSRLSESVQFVLPLSRSARGYELVTVEAWILSFKSICGYYLEMFPSHFSPLALLVNIIQSLYQYPRTNPKQTLSYYTFLYSPNRQTAIVTVRLTTIIQFHITISTIFNSPILNPNVHSGLALPC